MAARRPVRRSGAGGAGRAAAAAPAIPTRLPATPQTYVLVGGGYACVNAAVQVRRLKDADSRIVVFAGEDFCSKPSVLFRLKFPRRERIEYGRLDDAYWRKHGIELRRGRVAEIRPATQTVVPADGGDEIVYTHLLLATGGRPVIPELRFEATTAATAAAPVAAAAADSECSAFVAQRLEACGMPAGLRGLFPVRNPEEVEALQRRIAAGQHIVMVGSGTLALDLLSSIWEGGACAESGARITLVFRRATVGRPLFDGELADALTEILRARVGFVELRDSTSVETVLYDKESLAVCGVRLASAPSEVLACDAVVLAAGVEPDLDLARATGLACDRGVLVNERFETRVPGIYAAGDCCQPAGATGPWKNWNAAAEQGKAVATAWLTDADYKAPALVPHQNFKVFGANALVFGDDQSACECVVPYRPPGGDGEGRLLGTFCKVAWDPATRIVRACTFVGDAKKAMELQRLVQRKEALPGDFFDMPAV